MSFSTVTAMMLGVVSTGMGEGELKAPEARRLYGFGTLVNEQGEPSYSPPSFFQKYGGDGQPCYRDGSCNYGLRPVTTWNEWNQESCTCELLVYGRLGASPDAAGAGHASTKAKEASPSEWCPEVPERFRKFIPECQGLENHGGDATTQAPATTTQAPATTTKKPDDKNPKLGGSFYGHGGYNQPCYSDKTCNPGLIATTEWVHMPLNAFSVPSCKCTASYRLGAADAAQPTHAAADKDSKDTDSKDGDDKTESWCNMLPKEIKKLIPGCNGDADSKDDAADGSKPGKTDSLETHADSNEADSKDSNEPQTGKLGASWVHMPANAFSVPDNRGDSYDDSYENWAPAPKRSSCGGNGQRCCNWGSRCEYGLTANTQWSHMPANAFSVPRCTCEYVDY